MSVSNFLNSIDWAATARVAATRALAASIVWTAVIIWKSIGGGGQSFAIWQPVVIFLAILLVAVPLAALLGGVGRVLDRAGVPFTWVLGIVVLPLVLVAMVGDPLVWLVRLVKPGWVPVDKFGFINPTFLFVTRSAPPSQHALAT